MTGGVPPLDDRGYCGASPSAEDTDSVGVVMTSDSGLGMNGMEDVDSCEFVSSGMHNVFNSAHSPTFRVVLLHLGDSSVASKR